MAPIDIYIYIQACQVYSEGTSYNLPNQTERIALVESWRTYGYAAKSFETLGWI